MYWLKERRKSQRFVCDRCREVVYDQGIVCRYRICPFCLATKKGTKIKLNEYELEVLSK